MNNGKLIKAMLSDKIEVIVREIDNVFNDKEKKKTNIRLKDRY